MDEERFACILGNNNKVITAGNIKIADGWANNDYGIMLWIYQ